MELKYQTGNQKTRNNFA